MIVKIKKLEELPDAKHPNNIEEGFEFLSSVIPTEFTPPTVGSRFYVGPRWSTSKVVEILSETTFKTLNSIYQWEILSETTFKTLNSIYQWEIIEEGLLP